MKNWNKSVECREKKTARKIVNSGQKGNVGKNWTEIETKKIQTKYEGSRTKKWSEEMVKKQKKIVNAHLDPSISMRTIASCFHSNMPLSIICDK